MFKNIKLVAPYKIEGIDNVSLYEAMEYIKPLNKIGVDCETRAKAEYREVPDAGMIPYLSEIVMLQVGDYTNQFVIDTRYVDASPLVEVISDKE